MPDAAAAQRFLATVLFTDIVGSTELATELGDRAWRHLLEAHHALVRRKLREYHGREIDTAGDGFFASFDAPALGVRCALDIVRSAPEHGVHVRAGLHIGEVEQVGGRRGKIGGIAVHIGARVASAAGTDEVLVTSGVHDLSAGAGLQFDDRGTRPLKGVPGEWHLYAALSSEVAPARVSDEEKGARRAAAVRRVRTTPFWRRHPVWAAAAAALLLLLVGLGGLFAWSPWRPVALAGVHEDTVGVIDIERGVIIAQIPVGRGPAGVAVGGDAAWVANSTDDSVSRIDIATRAVVDTIPVGKLPTGVALGFGSVWVANSGERTVTRIDVSTSKVVDTIEVGNGPSAVAAGSDAVWVAIGADGTVARIDPNTGDVLVIGVGPTPVAIAADKAGVWVAHTAGGGAVTRIDPASRTPVAFVPLGSAPTGIALGSGSVWISSSGEGSLTRIDPATNRIVGVVAAGADSTGVGVSGQAVWVGSALDASLYRIDPSGGARRQIPIRSAPDGLAVMAAQVFFTARPSPASHRGGTLKVVSAEAPDSLDPAIAIGFGASWQILDVTNDGLVAFKRVAGPESAILVPDLAMAIPRPAEGGKAYTFQLRSGITFSDGTPVRADDVRASIERIFEVPWELLDPGQPSPGTVQYSGIVGADKCAEAAPAPCDLAEGIVVDAATNTVTFRLSAPDPFFLEKLALPYADVLPATTATGAEAAASLPFPATGPYMIAAYKAPVTQPGSGDVPEVVQPGELTLARNPKFTMWSADARPDGFAERIVFTIGLDIPEELRQVEAGEADWMVDRPPPEEIHRLQTTYPARLHGVLGSVTWGFINTTVAPLDNQDVRRAINFAVDRTRVLQLYGGKGAGAITCQLVPPAIAGYEPYCPYTTDPNPGGQWHGPDLAMAKQLVERSGTAGMVISVSTNKRHAEVGTYLAGVLNQIGYHASSATVDKYFKAVFVDRSVQIGVFEFVPDLPQTAVGWLRDPSSCAGTFNPAVFCDASIDQSIAGALTLQQEDPSQAWKSWAAIDRQITDAAPFIPLINPISYDFLSERVGNYSSGVLLDQLWVK